MKTYQKHIVTGPGLSQSVHFSNLQLAQAKAAAIGGDVKSYEAPSLRQLRRKVGGRAGMPTRPVRRAEARLSSAMGAYTGKESHTKPGASRKW